MDSTATNDIFSILQKMSDLEKQLEAAMQEKNALATQLEEVTQERNLFATEIRGLQCKVAELDAVVSEAFAAIGSKFSKQFQATVKRWVRQAQTEKSS